MVEIVNGTVIGTVTGEKPYAFYTLKGDAITGVKWFIDAEAAIAWFKEGWPSHFKAGVEMRVWDRP